jgi:hypothetical protein
MASIYDHPTSQHNNSHLLPDAPGPTTAPSFNTFDDDSEFKP